MTMTEDEARTKWCHKREIGARADGSLYGTCIASNCVAWRWTSQLIHVAAIRALLEEGASVPACKLIRQELGCGIREATLIMRRIEAGEDVVIPASAGYCGLAGKP